MVELSDSEGVGVEGHNFKIGNLNLPSVPAKTIDAGRVFKFFLNFLLQATAAMGGVVFTLTRDCECKGAEVVVVLAKLVATKFTKSGWEEKRLLDLWVNSEEFSKMFESLSAVFCNK